MRCLQNERIQVAKPILLLCNAFQPQWILLLVQRGVVKDVLQNVTPRKDV